ncbi:butyrophilin subfamily 3 member A2-like [Menidia menidia]
MVARSEGLSVLRASLLFGPVAGFLLLTHTCTGQPQRAPPPPLVGAPAGADAVLPCRLEPPADFSQLTVEWGRPDLEPRFVYVWHNGREQLGQQNEAFRGRAAASEGRLRRGDASLTLTGLRRSDSGKYRCYSPNNHREQLVQLLVGVASPASVDLAGLDGGRVVLRCQSAGWFPAPEVVWLRGGGDPLPSGPPESLRGPGGLFAVSSRVTVEKTLNNSFTCRVQQPRTNQSREAHIQVPDDFFISASDCSVSISFSLIFGLLLAFLVGGFIWKRQTKKKEAPNHEELQKELIRKDKSEKQSRLEEELTRSGQNVKTVKETIKELTSIKDELKQENDKFTTKREKAHKEADGRREKMKQVTKGVDENQGDKMANRAKGYLQLKELMLEENHKQDEGKKAYQDIQMKTEKCIQRFCEELKKLIEMGEEMELHVDKIKNQMENQEENVESAPRKNPDEIL